MTLEPLLDAIREGLETADWELSGLQKTTSYEFEGRWAGDSSRSAYLFFHRSGLPEWASIDVFLDETTRGLKGNLALVVDGPELGRMDDPEVVISELARLAGKVLPGGYGRPITLRYRLAAPEDNPQEADTEIRFKILLPRTAIAAGASAVAALAETTAVAFQKILESRGLKPYIDAESEDWDS